MIVGFSSQHQIGVGGERLASLRDSALRDEFFSWRGASGSRYVCSVFSRAQDAVAAGFAGAVVIGVVRRGAKRSAVCLLSSEELSAAAGHANVDEWHVLFEAGEAELRDLALSLLH